MSILTGSLLGDGHLTRPRKGNSQFVKNQCLRRAEYLNWHMCELSPFGSSISEGVSRIGNKEYGRCNFLSIAHEQFTNLRSIWYPQGKKVIPANITLDHLAICIWFMDDGYNYVKERHASFATQSFENVDPLIAELSKHGVNSYHKTSEGTLVIRGDSYDHFMNLITKEMVWACFQYKIEVRPAIYKTTTAEQRAEVLKLRQKGLSVQEIAEAVKVGRGVVSRLLRKDLLVGSPPLNSTSGVKGVYFDRVRNKWVATLDRKHIGRFDTLELAKLAQEKVKVGGQTCRYDKYG